MVEKESSISVEEPTSTLAIEHPAAPDLFEDEELILEQDDTDTTPPENIAEDSDVMLSASAPSGSHIRKRSNFKKVFQTCFLVISLGLTAVFIFVSMSNSNIVFADLQGIKVNGYYIFGAVGFIYLSILMESSRVQVLMYKGCKAFKPALCIKAVMLGRYFDYITPWQSGGKPYQLYYFHSRGVEEKAATSVPISDFIANKLNFCIFAITIVLTCSKYLLTDDPAFMGLFVYGIVINILTVVSLVFITISSKTTNIIVRVVVKSLHKLHLVKNPNQIIAKTHVTFENYRDTVRKFIKSPLVVLSSFAFTAAIYLCYAGVTLSIYSAFFGFSLSKFPLILLGTVLFEYLMCSVPLPGGTGGVEKVFFTLFAAPALFTEPEIFLALLIWKGLTFVLQVLNGLTVFVYDSVYGNKKNKRKLAKIASQLTQ